MKIPTDLTYRTHTVPPRLTQKVNLLIFFVNNMTSFFLPSYRQSYLMNKMYVRILRHNNYGKERTYSQALNHK